MSFITLAQQGGYAGPEQGTAEWFENRKNKMTGSKPSSIMFDCVDKESYARLWGEYFGGLKKEEFDEKQQAAVDWGSNNEDNACKEFISQMNGFYVFETSLIDHPIYKWMAASPDGYIVRVKTGENNEIIKPFEVIERAAFEIKCSGSRFRDSGGNVEPYKMMKDLEKKSNPPYYYMAQVHFEMVMLGVNVTYFYMWTPWYSKLWKIDFDNDYWTQTVSVLKAFYEKEIPFDCLLSKINVWKTSSQNISRRYKPYKIFSHATDEGYKTIEAEKEKKKREEEEKKKQKQTQKYKQTLKFEKKNINIKHWKWAGAKDIALLDFLKNNT